MKSVPVQVLLVDDHYMLLEALTARLEMEPDFEVVGTACDSERGFFQALELRPDILVLDIELPGRGSFTIAEELRARLPAMKIVFLTGFLSDVFVDQALRVGASGYLMKGESTAEFVAALRSVMKGETCFSAAVSDRLEFDPSEGVFQVKSQTLLNDLTGRQMEVLRHLARGESVKEVARSMTLSERAIESHKYRIMQKLGIHDRVELTRYAIREGLTVP
ncbi:MAG: response regulator transcription factor [Planctomycetaceae bacterium]|nr:response regulator transcription factor [Planctomycetaceae bacterium]